jgi:hypothetical protein
MRCGYYFGMGHIEHKCWKHGKDGKAQFVANNYLEILVDDEDAMLEELNKLCATKHDVFIIVKIPRKCLFIKATNGEVVCDHEAGHVDINTSSIIRSKIFTHFVKGKISHGNYFGYTKRIGVESLKNLVNLAKKKCSEGLKLINLIKVEGPTIVCRINVHNNHCSKTLHLLLEINNHLVKGLVDTGTSMSMMSTKMVCELGIMHLVFGLKYYETTFGVVTQTINKINLLPIKVSDV